MCSLSFQEGSRDLKLDWRALALGLAAHQELSLGTPGIGGPAAVFVASMGVGGFKVPPFKRLQGEPTRKPPLHLDMLAVLQNPPGCVLPHSGLIASRLQRPNPELACPAYAQESH